MQKIDLRNKSSKQFLIKNENEVVTKTKKFKFFSIVFFFGSSPLSF